ncbi:MAG: SpoVG family protein [Planctomycetota bacterium]
MKISEIRVSLVGDPEDPKDKLKAFCSVTFDGEIAIREVKVVLGARGLFVAMPSRSLMAPCQACGCRNPVRARFCNDCGKHVHVPRHLAEARYQHVDVAHPISAEARAALQEAVLEGYRLEVEASRRSGYARRDERDGLEDPEPGPDRRRGEGRGRPGRGGDLGAEAGA